MFDVKSSTVLILDTYGLLLFLGVQPYNHFTWFKRALFDHYENGNCLPLFDLMSRLMWRSCKVDVLDEICIPKQTEYLSWLQFSAVEHHFYQKEFDRLSVTCEADIKKRFPDINSRSIPMSEMSKDVMSWLLSRLLTLRQACIHPAVSKSSYLSLEKTCVTMEQVLKKLIDNTRLECEEAHRKLICALNGAAGVELLQKNVVAASNYYCEAIKSWRENKELKTDSLQVV